MINNIFKIFIAVILLLQTPLFGQVENVPVQHPVYEFLIRAEARGFLPHFSTSQLPIERKEIQNALNEIKKNLAQLNSTEKHVFEEHLKEFGLMTIDKVVLFYSSSDSEQVLSNKFFYNNDKYFYHYTDSNNTVNLKPLGSFESLFSSEPEKKRNVSLGNLGFRLYGSLGKHFGYLLQATNGVIISGNRELALQEFEKLRQNVKFADLNSDFDFSESHIRFDYDWFYATLGRETQLIGSGIGQRLFVSDNAAPADGLTLGAKFSNFEYRYTHSGILAVDQAKNKVGFNAEFPDKYLVTHRFSIRPSWGEFSFWEGIIYSKRDIDLAYLNPLSFFKSLEHALHDRDNSLMGADLTFRIFLGLQLKGSYLLDDIEFDKIGTKHWKNKSAWNIGLIYCLPFNLDIGLEYARVEPYTFSHFVSVNSYTNDEMLIGTGLLPNSDELSLVIKYWWFGSHHPIIARISRDRYGSNVYDSDGNLLKNVGGDPLQTKRPEDSDKVSFLGGDLMNSLRFDLLISYEILKDFHIEANYGFRNIVDKNSQIFLMKFAFIDF